MSVFRLYPCQFCIHFLPRTKSSVRCLL
uniref:Uncharacterized protein n=1 Tax=Arundo donax TaxID=35708 RepID=A0A0A9H2M5_ARUDO